MNAKPVDILNLEWPQSERDVHSIAPVVIELRVRGYTCITGDIFSYIFYLIKYRPKVLLISNFQGAEINNELCKLAFKLGIAVISLIAEGNIRENAVEQMTWGHNKKNKDVYFEKLLVWSERSKGLMEKYFPSIKDRVIACGNVAADRYKRLPFMEQEVFLSNEAVGKSYRKIVGLAGWGFDRVHDTEFFRKNRSAIVANSSMEQIARHRSDFVKLKKVYKEIIVNNPDVLFIVRSHPGLTDKLYNEFSEVINYPNVYFSEPRKCRYNISELISASDLWGGYESTTCLEAWLLGKNTFLINPSGGDFIRDVTANGSEIITNSKLFSDILKYNQTDLNKFFDGKKKNQSDIIKNVIGFDDGNNYLRVVKEIESTLIVTLRKTYTIKDLLSSFTPSYLIRSLIRNINIINNARGIRCTDQLQMEREMEVYKKCLKNDTR